jgi:tetraacyldisaccharide 4'-kinase
MFRWTFLLLPFSILFGLITFIRNLFYDFGLFSYYKIPIKSILIGNLSVGGTGKTPHVYYISKYLSTKFKIAILSRGYGRKSKGYFDVLSESKALEVGDEPLLLKSRLLNVHVAVSESREFGVNKLIDKYKPEVVVLDDAFQHRRVKAGLSIILTEFNKPYFNDFLMPTGRLREFSIGKKRADIVIVTKCPDVLNTDEKARFIEKLKFNPSKVFFSKIVYSPIQSFSNYQIDSIKSVFLVTAIADDSKIVEYLSRFFSVKTFKFRDHHTFTEEDITKIHLKFDVLRKEGSIILTTEKDFVKLKEFSIVKEGQYPWYYLPINIEIDREIEFNQILENYVGTV